jgi:spermidine synthase
MGSAHLNEIEVAHVNNRGLLVYLLLTAVVCGALIMVVEVLGSRVVGPFFGVSLFVWTSLIAVTLIALAAGYGLGGLLADRRGTPEYLYAIILVAGLLVLLIPVLKASVLKLSIPLGLRLGAFTSTTLLFGPSLFLLGCVSPYLVKIAGREMRNIGRTVGGFYALSTLGSVLGTVLTGFVLIAYLGVDHIFYMVGWLLVMLAMGYFLLFRRAWYAAVLLCLPLLITMPEDPKGFELSMPDGTRVIEVQSQESFYGGLKVVDYRYGTKHHRELMIDGLIQGGVDMVSGLSVYEYCYLLQFIPYGLNPQGKKALVVGLGAGVVPSWYERQGVVTDVVDIDPEVVKLARGYFGYKPLGNVHIQDARYFLSNTQEQYDFAVLDVFNGDTTPTHLLSVEAMALLKQRLRPGGVLGINMVASLQHDSMITASVHKTLSTLFDQVEFYPVFDVNGEEGVGNLVVIAYQGESRRADYSRVPNQQIYAMTQQQVIKALKGPIAAPTHPDALILTDNYNPSEFFDLHMKEWVRRSILDGTPWDLLIRS